MPLSVQLPEQVFQRQEAQTGEEHVSSVEEERVPVSLRVWLSPDS